ncbi:MAG: phosphonate metabolism protein/1,5-bisphosphokinase (PRPP-forming) PhnN [Opitutaceae bacterium]
MNTIREISGIGPQPGVLFYVIGPSGAGKDSLMTHARAKLGGADEPLVMFAHRYITRPAEAGGENHVAVSRAEFERMRANGHFAFAWESHGQGYGIGREIELWLERGASVVMNGSREYLPEAARRHPDLCVVLIEASPSVLRARLEARGRESPLEIERRLSRAAAFTVEPPRLARISNNGALAEAGDRLLRVLASPPPVRTERVLLPAE